MRHSIYASVLLSIFVASCKQRTSKVSDSDIRNAGHMTRIQESLEFSMTTLDASVVFDAALIARASFQFGLEMGELYNSCHSPPTCPNQVLDFAEDPIPPLDYFSRTRMKDSERAGDQYCYPNAVLRNGKTGEVSGYGYWVTGKTGVPLAEQQAARERGEAVAKNYFKIDSGVANAARHSFLFCYLAGLHGYELAKVMSDNHELYFPEDGLEDTWADYWNNEQGMRFGAILHRTLASSSSIGADANRSYAQRVRNAYLTYQKTTRTLPPNAVPDIIDLRLIDFDAQYAIRENEYAISLSCKRYLEGMIRGEVMVTEKAGEKPAPTYLMTHRPTVRTRQDLKTFAPLLGQESEIANLVPMSRFQLPNNTRGGLQWMNSAPIPPKRECVNNPERQPRYWSPLPPTLPWADGDYFKYWPSFDPKRDRHAL